MIIVFIIIFCLFLAQYFAYEELERRLKGLEILEEGNKTAFYIKPAPEVKKKNKKR